MEQPSLKQTIINAALDHAYPNVEQLVEDFARRFALENMGQRLVDHLQSVRVTPDRVYASCWNSLYQSSESDEMARGLEAERKAWVKDGKKCAKKVQAKKLRLTMRNMEEAWYGRGPFAKGA